MGDVTDFPTKIEIPGCPYEAFLLTGINAIQLNCSEAEYYEIIPKLDLDWIVENNLSNAIVIYDYED